MDENIARRVGRLEKDLLAMKSPQPIGSNSVRVYDTLTNFVWDYDYTMTAANYNGIFYSHGFGIKFTSRNQSAPFAAIKFFAKINGVDYNPLWSTVTGAPTTGPGDSSISVAEDVFNTGSLSDYAKDNTVRWSINTDSHTLGTNFKIKIVVTATDMGKIDIRLNDTF